MPAELTSAIESIQAWLAQVPPAIIAAILLGGPTAAWILYRTWSAPQRRRYPEDGEDLLWICERCRSANEVRSSHCYRCGLDREATTGDLTVVDGEGLVTLGPDAIPVGPGHTGPGVPVGPGQPGGTPALAPARPLAAVGPGHPDVVAPRRAVTSAAVRSEAGRSTPGPEPAEAQDEGPLETPSWSGR